MIFVCSHCDTQFPKWSGRCSECGKWGTIPEAGQLDAVVGARASHAADIQKTTAATVQRFQDVSVQNSKRISSGLSEVDRVLGGGIVPGSLVLFGGDPGIGKSTLVAQIAGHIPEPVLYVSGEESASQIKLRLDRLAIKQDHLSYSGDDHIEAISRAIIDTAPALAIIDSIQTVASSQVDSEPGSVNQIKACTVRLLEVAKATGVPILIIGHVTKGGDIGGPRALEHLVDVVLYIEGDRQHQFRILRAVKNRFGSTKEIGVFEMKTTGLVEVADPSKTFLADRSNTPGSCITTVSEGNRIFLIEVQALVAKTVFGYPQRKCSGFDVNRLNVLLAVLDRRAGLSFADLDVYINIVGGAAASGPELDLAVCLALASAASDRALPITLAAWGEVGLGGEVRSVAHDADRAAEAKRFGFTTVMSAKTCKTVRQAVASITS